MATDTPMDDLEAVAPTIRGESEYGRAGPDCEDVWLALGTVAAIARETGAEMQKRGRERDSRWTPIEPREFIETAARLFYQGAETLEEMDCAGNVEPVQETAEDEGLGYIAEWETFEEVYGDLYDLVKRQMPQPIRDELDDPYGDAGGPSGAAASRDTPAKAVCTTGESPTELEQNINDILEDAHDQGYEVTDMTAAQDDGEAICVLLHEVADEME